MLTTVLSIKHGDIKKTSAVHQAPKSTRGDIKKSFTLHQAPKSYTKSGPAHMLSAYHRLNVVPPKRLEAAVAAYKGTVTASPTTFDEVYLVTITIGEQSFDVSFDTGTSDL